MSFDKKVFRYQSLRFCLCSVHRVSILELGLHMYVRWLQDSSYFFICGSLYDASSNWLASNIVYVCL
jgi:hypothetical protein